jgi:hypothetical protein
MAHVIDERRWLWCVELDVVRLDVLMWRLAGFTLPKDQRCPTRCERGRGPHDAETIRMIRRLASDFDRVPWGLYPVMSHRYGVSENSLKVMVCRCRQGLEPKSWAARVEC